MRAWKINENGHADNIRQLTEELMVSPVISTLLVQRGITNYTQAKAFFRPYISQLYDPFLMADMEKAVSRLEKALKNKEKILVYGDYDVDGTTSVAMVFSFLKKYTGTVDYYIPDRYAEGYGVSFRGIDHAIQHGFSLKDCQFSSKWISRRQKTESGRSIFLKIWQKKLHRLEKTARDIAEARKQIPIQSLAYVNFRLVG